MMSRKSRLLWLPSVSAVRLATHEQSRPCSLFYPACFAEHQQDHLKEVIGVTEAMVPDQPCVCSEAVAPIGTDAALPGAL